MSDFLKKHWKAAVGVVVGIGVIVFFGVEHYMNKKSAVPKGIAWGNGRIEATQVDVSSKLPLRVKSIFVEEGDLVKPGQVVGVMDTLTLEAELEEAKGSLAAAQEQMAVASAAISRKKSEIQLAKIEKERSGHLVAERAGSQREYDVRTMTLKTTTAGLKEEEAKLRVASEQVKVAEAAVAKSQTRIDDATLRSPILGRVLYRLAEPGEVLAAGGKALTLVNLEDVYMEIFLPSDQAAAVKIGSEARFTVDYEPNRAAVGYVSFVSPEAQFTPKEVETRSEREKLMFRVKIQVPRELVVHYIERIKTGVRGVGYVRLNESVHWPAWLEKNLVRPVEREGPKISATVPSLGANGK
jgi:HlyD family secretion protein